MFYGAKAGDVQPDWLDTSKIAIPQADEQQRLLVNLITQMERSKLPLPHFWYLPRGKKAVVVMSGDDHSPVRGEGARPATSTASSSSARRLRRGELGVRALDLLHLSEQQRSPTRRPAGYTADGFEVALHPSYGGCNATLGSPGDLAALFDTQLAQFQAKYTSVPALVVEPHPLRLLARLGIRGEDRARPRDPDGRATTTTTPRPGSGRSPAS